MMKHYSPSVVSSSVGPYEMSILDISQCCDVIVGAFASRLETEARALKRACAKKVANAEKKEDGDAKKRRLNELLLELERNTCAIERAREKALAVLGDLPARSIDQSIRCLEEFSGMDCRNDGERAVFDAADAMLPLVKRLKTLLHIARAYPGEVKKRCEKLRREAGQTASGAA